VRPPEAQGSLTNTIFPGQNGGEESPLVSSSPSSERIRWNLASWVVWDTKLAVSVSRRRSFQRNGLPYSASNGVRLNEFGVFLSRAGPVVTALARGGEFLEPT
jgi:hypothetical protein